MKSNDFRSLFLLFILTDCGFSFLDITELSSFQYSIDISNQPVLLDEAKDKEGILLSSKHGQKYQCQFESLSKFSQKVRDEEENASKMSVTELLETMKAKPCLTLTTGWWTYEFCYKGQIKQYHVTDQKVLGDVLHLGSYSDEFDWDANHDKKAPEVRNRFHSQQYVNGSLCDLTGTMRSAEVRFKCKEDSADAMEGVEEPSTCKYLVHITTPHLCRHPSLRSVPDKKSLPITCNPVLDVSDYNDYVEMQTRLKEEREKGLVEGEKGDSSGSDLDKINNDLDGEFGFIEIGNTKVKFYVLNIDPANSEDVKKDEKSASIESSTSDKELVASSTSLITTTESTESSSSSSTSSSLESSASAIDKSDGADATTKIVSNEDGIPDNFFGDDTKEFLEIYKRLLSNKKLKSFIDKEREAVKNVEQEKSMADDRSAVEETPVEGEGSTQTTQSGESEVGGEPGVGEEKVIEKERSDDVMETNEKSVEISEVGEKESFELSEGSKGDDVKAEDEIAETESKSSKEISSKEGGDDDDDDKSKVDKSGTKTETKVMKLKIDQHVAGDLFKNENQFPEEHKNIHQMIMDIIRQSDRNTKEVIRHEAMSRNYDFDWKKQKKRDSKVKKSEGLKDEL